MVTSSVAVRNAALASAYLTGSMRRFHLIVFTPKIGCSKAVSYTHLDVYKRQALYVPNSILLVPMASQ